MRWVFFSLLFVNAVALVWQLLAPGDKASAADTNLAQRSRLEGVPGITLLNELKHNELAAMLQKKKRLRMTAKIDALPAANSEKPLCTLVGPFKQLLKAEYFVERMSALDINAEVQEVEIPEDVGFWVYLPPEVSRKEALRRLHELQGKGIDSYVIPKGELANGISFGMFSQQALALSRQKQMQRQGYDVEIKEVARSFKEVWAILTPAEAEKLGEDLWQKVLSGNPELDRRQNFCPTVASSDNFN